MTDKKTTLYIIADQALVGEGLAGIVSSQQDIHVLGQAHEIPEALQALEKIDPDVVLLNSQSNPWIRQGVEDLVYTFPSLRLLILATQLDNREMKIGLRMGVMGYLQRDMVSHDLYRAIRAIASDQAWAPRALLTEVVRESCVQGNPHGSRSLTKREGDVLGLLARGLTNKEIGGKLDISEKTVKAHLNLLYQKLNISHRAQAAAYAAKYVLMATG